MKRNQKYQKTSFIAGLILIALGAIYSLGEIGSDLISLIFINGGLLLAVLSIIKFNKFGAGVKQDERTRQSASVSLSYSWLFTFVAINIIFWLSWFKIINLSFMQGISLITFVMIVSASLFKWQLNNKGYQDEQ